MSAPGLLTVDRVSKFFSGQRGERIEAVRDVSLEIKEGEFVGIVGPSGCGKTTLLNIIAGLIPVDAGRVIIDLGSSPGSNDFRKAYLFQRDTTLPWLSVRKNLEISVITTEILISSGGLGALIIIATAYLDTPRVFSIIFVSMITSVVLVGIARYAINRVFPWIVAVR